MIVPLAVIGIAFLGAAVVGGGLEAFSVKVGILASGRRQLLLACVGAVALAVSFSPSILKSSTHSSSPRQPNPTVTSGLSQGSSPAQPASSTAQAPGKVLTKKDNVQLTSGYALSISDPNLMPVPNSGCAGDLWICGSTDIGSSAPAQLAAYSGTPQPAGFSQCQSDTNYVSADGEMPQQSLVGTTLCVTTTDRVAVCYITGDTRWTTSPTNGLTMDVTVYSKH